MQTSDTIIYGESMANSGESERAPFLEKTYAVTADDNTATDYSRNQIQFNTSGANSSRWADYKNAYMVFPTTTVMSRSAYNEAAADGANGIHWKSGPVLIDSVQIEYNNSSIVQQRRDVTAWASFIQHTTMSENDRLVKGPSVGYFKPSSEWDYEDERGLVSGDSLPASAIDSEFARNTGLGKAELMADTTIKNSGADTYVYIAPVPEVPGVGGGAATPAVPAKHVYYKNVMIRLRDILNLFENLPLIKGGAMTITLTFNQAKMVTTYTAGVVSAVAPTLQGLAFPVLRVNPTGLAGHDLVETIQVAVGRIAGYDQPADNQCRLHVPTYTLAPEAELALLSKGVQKVKFDDLNIVSLKNNEPGREFSLLVSNSQTRMKRIIVVPTLSASGNGAMQQLPCTSQFCSEPATPSPCFIRNMNVLLGGSPVYTKNIRYKYETFLDEVEAKFGVQAGRDTGLSSSLISLSDYESNYGYFVCDLTRRFDIDRDEPVNVRITGTIESAKNLDFLVYIEFEKEISFDLSTGAVVD